MSLINKMLQDLEQRNDSATRSEPMAGEVRAVPAASAPRTGAMVGGLVVLVVAIGVGWMMMQPTAAPPVVVAAAPAKPAQVAVPAPAPVPAAVAAAPAQLVAVAPVSTPAVAIASASAVATASAAAPAAAKVAQAVAAAKPAAEPKVKQAAAALVAANSAPPQGVTKQPSKVMSEEASPAVQKTATVVAPAAEARWQKRFTPQQQSDNLYKQAITQLQQGQGTDARKSLRLALEVNPNNVKARQVLVDMQVEAGSVEEASALLRDGLRLSPEQSGLSMSLARLQLETGDTAAAMTTLEQGLKSAGDEPQYNAFYAVLLQRAKRHDEAVNHYLVALRSDPSMPTWLVGIGISLQALGKNADASEAFQRARDSGLLTPQLAQFVDQKLNQLK